MKKIKTANQRPHVDIYTDGACSNGLGGWGASLRCNGEALHLCGNEANTTNNRMELTAVIKALETLTQSCEVTVYSDSQYVVNGMMSWVKVWKRKGWLTKDNKPVVNKDLWERLLSLMTGHKIRAQWVKGHASNEDNNFVDFLAQHMRQQPIS